MVSALPAPVARRPEHASRPSASSNATLLPRYTTAGKVAAFIFLVGFGAIPVAILAGFLAA